MERKEIIGVEALLRWPEFSQMNSTEHFVTVIERMGLASKLNK